MFTEVFFWVLLLLYLIPLLITGIILLRKVSLIDRYELLIPAGSVLGLTLFTFFINIFSFITESRQAIYLSYFFLLLIGIFVYKLKSKIPKISTPSDKSLYFLLISVLGWLLLIFWKGNSALIGSDTNLYYSVAHTYLKGNFPPLTPWQPDLPLSYHLGSFQLLAAFYLFTNLSFEFLHIFFSCLFIFCSSQIIIWSWKRTDNIPSFIFGNLSAAIVLISFGFFKLMIPLFPLKLPQISDLHQLFLWIRDLPTVNQSIEVYGAPINLDSLIYFVFHSFGLAIALFLLTLTFYQRKEKPYLTWIVVGLGLSALALINESVFILLSPALLIGQLALEIIDKSLRKNALAISLVWVTIGLIVLFQGGVITNILFHQTNLEKSILFLPSKIDSREDFAAYHYYQEISKILPIEQRWLPFRWFTIGTEILILIPVAFFIFIKTSKEKIFILAFFLSGLFSLLSYNFIVPKFLAANGNRLLAFSFIFLSLATFFSFPALINTIPDKKVIKNLLITMMIIFVILPTILPPLVLLSKNRFGENKLVPNMEQKTAGIKWIEKNIPYNKNIVVLDARTPHPSGQSRVMMQAGVFAPIFPGDFRAYTIEASPEYFDIAYSLSPSALKKLKISMILIDYQFFQTLPQIRKEQLENSAYFRKIFDNSDIQNQNWEKIYTINDEYIKMGKEIDGTFRDLKQVIPNQGRIYIDNEENFYPSYLRRAVIFSLRDRDLYYLPQSGVYLNVEAYINQNNPQNRNYDYLVLGPNTDPKSICGCRAKIIFRGLNNKTYVWRTEYSGNFEK